MAHSEQCVVLALLTEVAEAFGFDDAVAYLDALKKEGPEILRRLQGVT